MQTTGYFKSLDSLRALASMIVVIGHIELFKKNNSIPNIVDMVPSGHLGVILFFVLSGFLITYLIVKELESKSFSFKKFYLRRILRIWPLYYLILIISYISFEPSISIRGLLLSLSIFPNVANAIGEGWQTSPQIWSIGVEEQFYLVWPFIIYLVPQKKIIMVLIH
jgi:peptidoglycan/LPS O-acetylase OafA/YrhL